MKTDTVLHADHQLDQLAGQFEHWRQNRSHHGECMPKPRWDQAATLARVLPYTRVAKHLHLAARALKEHMAKGQGATSAPPNSPPPFVEIPPVSAWPPAAVAMEIELERPDGARLRLRYPGSPSPVAVLVRTFFEGTR